MKRFLVQGQYPPDKEWVTIGEYDDIHTAHKARAFVGPKPYQAEQYRVVDNHTFTAEDLS